LSKTGGPEGGELGGFVSEVNKEGRSKVLILAHQLIGSVVKIYNREANPRAWCGWGETGFEGAGGKHVAVNGKGKVTANVVFNSRQSFYEGERGHDGITYRGIEEEIGVGGGGVGPVVSWNGVGD